jgi:hypothetical protein
MASRQIKMPEKDVSEQAIDEAFPQRKRPEVGRYLLQVDRQTKRSFQTQEEAQKAGMIIKKDRPILQVSVYDSGECISTILESPAAS